MKRWPSGLEILCFTSYFFCALILVEADDTACIFLDQSCGLPDQGKLSMDEIGQKAKTFFQEKIFGRIETDDDDHDTTEAMFGEGGTDNESASVENIVEKLMGSRFILGKKKVETPPTDETKNEFLASLLGQVRMNLDHLDKNIIGFEFLDIILDAMDKAYGQLQNTFGDLVEDIDITIPLALKYFLEQEDGMKNPSWKRGQHKFHSSIPKKKVMELHEALYLSQLTYVSTIEEFNLGLSKFQNGMWELGYGIAKSLPDMPAHFLLIHKNIKPLPDTKYQIPLLPWEYIKDTELLVALAVRGTKELADAIADASLEPVEYREGYSHSGILKNGLNLAKRLLPKLEELLKLSGRDKIRLYLAGHSLGAAAAAIAAIEFNDYEWIIAESVGFGCPSLLSQELSESTKDFVTTVVADADIVPRMSGASINNLFLDLIEFDWTSSVLKDIEVSLEKVRALKPLIKNILPKTDDVLQWAEELINSKIRPKLDEREKKKRIPNFLIPPGNCIHFYRDGVGYSASYIPCSFFSSIDLARTLVDDHMIMTGYHRAMVTIVRDWEKNFNFDFEHDIASIPA